MPLPCRVPMAFVLLFAPAAFCMTLKLLLPLRMVHEGGHTDTLW